MGRVETDSEVYADGSNQKDQGESASEGEIGSMRFSEQV